MESIITSKNSIIKNPLKILTLRARMIINGINISNKIKNLISESLLLHINVGIPLNKNLLSDINLVITIFHLFIFKGLEMLKAIEFNIKENE